MNSTTASNSDWNLLEKDVVGLRKFLELQSGLLADLEKRVERLRPVSPDAVTRTHSDSDDN
jgi:hypothetical protein